MLLLDPWTPQNTNPHVRSPATNTTQSTSSEVRRTWPNKKPTTLLQKQSTLGMKSGIMSLLAFPNGDQKSTRRLQNSLSWISYAFWGLCIEGELPWFRISESGLIYGALKALSVRGILGRKISLLRRRGEFLLCYSKFSKTGWKKLWFCGLRMHCDSWDEWRLLSWEVRGESLVLCCCDFKRRFFFSDIAPLAFMWALISVLHFSKWSRKGMRNKH